MSEGLRERKKARTRAAIREHALRLFLEQGYTATTVEQIAAAAEVSPSTFFRYFPTKEDVVLQDDLDTRMLAALDRQPPGLTIIAAIRAAVREALASYSEADIAVITETTRLTVTEPAIRARAIDELGRTIAMIAAAIARRTGKSPDDLAVRAAAGAVIGVIMGVTMGVTAPFENWADGDQERLLSSFGQIDEALGMLEAGLPL